MLFCCCCPPPCLPWPSTHAAEKLNAPVTAENLPPIEKVTGPGLDVGSLDDRPQVAGELRLHLRRRQETATGSKQWNVVERTADWQASQTAIIICDMWNDHFCVSAAQRVGVMAPKMNRVLTAARAAGVLIIHAPSGVTQAYADTNQRKRMLAVLLGRATGAD